MAKPWPFFAPPRLTWTITKPKKPGETTPRHASSEETIDYSISISASEATVGLEVV